MARRNGLYGMSMEEREHNKSESRTMKMGEAGRKLKRASLAQAELVKSGVVAARLQQPASIDAEAVVITAKKQRTAPTMDTTMVTYPEPLVLVAQLVDILTNLPVLFEQADGAVNRMDIELGDLNHAVELLPLPKREAHKIMQEIKHNRVERRRAKDFGQKSQPLYNFIKSKPNLLGEVLNLQKELLRLNEALGRRTYTPRVRQDLQELFTAKRGAAITVALTSEGGE